MEAQQNRLLTAVMRIILILLFASVIWGVLLILLYFIPAVVQLECNRKQANANGTCEIQQICHWQ